MAKNNTRENISNAALELFSTNGYTSTTTKLIADKAEVNEVTIFRHFGTKEFLFQEVIKNYVEKLDFMEKIYTYKKFEPDQAIKKIGIEFLENCYANERLYKIQMKMQEDMLDGNKLRMSRSFIDGFEVYLSWLKDEGRIYGDPKIMSKNFVLSILGVFTFYVLTNDLTTEEVEKLINCQIDNFIKNNNI